MVQAVATVGPVELPGALLFDGFTAAVVEPDLGDNVEGEVLVDEDIDEKDGAGLARLLVVKLDPALPFLPAHEGVSGGVAGLDVDFALLDVEAGALIEHGVAGGCSVDAEQVDLARPLHGKHLVRHLGGGLL